MISRIYPLMTVYTVRGGQRKSSKHVINFPQNFSRFANNLSQLPQDIPLIVRRMNLNDEKHYDFRVRRPKVEAALQWLKQHNKWYRDVTISPARLSPIPLDDNLEHLFARDVNNLDISEAPDLAAVDQPNDDGTNVDARAGDDLGILLENRLY